MDLSKNQIIDKWNEIRRRNNSNDLKLSKSFVKKINQLTP